MTSALTEPLLQSLAWISALLLLGMFLRAKVVLFQRLLLPASVIGGLVGLLLGPNVLGTVTHGICLPVSDEFLSCWSVLPGILIIPIFAAAPLGHGAETGQNKSTIRTHGPHILIACGIFSCVTSLQTIIGLGTNLMFDKLGLGWDLYRTFGIELSQGFAGGHGTAAALGGILESFGLSYWHISMSVAITCATVGLIGGMLLGILFLARGTRKQQFHQQNAQSGQIPSHIRTGIITDRSQQPSAGRESTASSSIDVLTVHLALILLGCGLAYWLRSILIASPSTWISEIFYGIPVWFLALLLMYGVNWGLNQWKLSWLIDRRIKNRITGMLSDLAITAAIASCNVQAIMDYLIPTSFMCLVGFGITYLVIFPLHRLLFRGSFPEERAILCWGVNTGVMINGIMLLKICDPNYETPALNDFAMAVALFSIISIPIAPITWKLVASGSTWANLWWNILLCTAFLLMAAAGYLLETRQKVRH